MKSECVFYVPRVRFTKNWFLPVFPALDVSKSEVMSKNLRASLQQGGGFVQGGHAIDAVLPQVQTRHRVNKQISDTRERLASISGTNREFNYELLNKFTQTRLSASIALAALAFISAFMLGYAIFTDSSEGTSARNFALITCFAVLTTHAGMIYAVNRFQKLKPTEVNTGYWSRLFVTLDFIYGLSWLFFLPTLTQEGQTIDAFMIVSGLIVIAAMAMIAAALPKAVYAATLPIALGLALFFIGRGTHVGYILGSTVLVAEVFFIFVASRLYAADLASLMARAEKESLIAELELARHQSDLARADAEKANVAKSRFLAQMSHELRTPLNAILGFSEVIKNEMFGALAVPAYKEYATDIHDSGGHLLALINEILDLSRIESGKQELNEEALTLAYICEDCHHLLRVRAKNKGVEIIEHYEEEMPKLWADEKAVRQIILNLMSNAIKFTPKGGSVTLKAGWTASGGQYVAVKDSGMGIPEDEMADVLSNFGQGTNALKTAEQGTGLGLPIVQGLVGLHGGQFMLRSKVGVGTEAIALFPAERVIEALEMIESPPIQGGNNTPLRMKTRQEV
jgi:two-component system, cell cycle sensor histidine kinase PleC